MPRYEPGPICRPVPLPSLTTLAIFEPSEPPTNWMPAPLKPVIRLGVAIGPANTTLLTPFPITRPFVADAAPLSNSTGRLPLRLIAFANVTLAALDTVSPASGVSPPTVPANEIAFGVESVSRATPSTVSVKVIVLPALTATSVTEGAGPRTVKVLPMRTGPA